jgi:hypothetical protein
MYLTILSTGHTGLYLDKHFLENPVIRTTEGPCLHKILIETPEMNSLLVLPRCKDRKISNK